MCKIKRGCITIEPSVSQEGVLLRSRSFTLKRLQFAGSVAACVGTMLLPILGAIGACCGVSGGRGEHASSMNALRIETLQN